MIVAGIGCRRACPAERIVALVAEAESLTGARVQALAAPDFKQDEPGLRDAAERLGLPLLLVDAAALAAVQPDCVTRSATALRAVGAASVAEGAALAGGGPPLLLPRFGRGEATCALAGVPGPAAAGLASAPAVDCFPAVPASP